MPAPVFMYRGFISVTVIVLTCALIIACSSSKKTGNTAYVYRPDSKELYDTIIRMDSIFWKAYNTCDIATQARLYSDSLEFYHDKGGLSTSKQDILLSIEKNICNKVTREAIPGSIEIYPIPNYGAVEMGLHKFHNKLEPDAPSHPGRFIIVWQQSGGQWKMRRVISLH